MELLTTRMASFLTFWTLCVIYGVSSEDLKPGNWASCQNNQDIPTRTDTSKAVKQLRDMLVKNNVGAYIIPSGDVHLSEFVADYDKRREFISGFSGSSGTAVVSQTKAALWTDGRYFLQAEGELGCDWILMREGEPGVPTIAEWLGSIGAKTVGASPNFFGNKAWTKLKADLKTQGVALSSKVWDYIDQIWGFGRPPLPSTSINVYPLKYAGVSWQDKVRDIREEMSSRNADVLVITSLDETAWLFNLRATDITGVVNDPFFYSFAIIQPNSIRLYIKDHESKLTAEPEDPALGNITVMAHLNTGGTGSCSFGTKMCVQVEEYDHGLFIRDIGTLTRSDAVKRVWVSYCNYAIYSNIPEEKVFVDNTPAAMMKTRKNAVEVQGMKNSHVRDGAAVARFMSKLEKTLKAGKDWDEMLAMAELSKARSMQDLARGNSFVAISSVGPNAAINHYFANNATNRPITLNETYLLDSGGQYLDGTTDITRTFLFSEPTDFVKECYTRVLMGHIELAMVKWNKGLFGREIDIVARKPLLDVGLVYRHGTGHGIGHYLSVHEGPGRISNYHARFDWDVPLDENMFFSDEPGYYQDGEFGIRLENIIYVKKIESQYKMPGVTMFGMETVTLFPYEPHLIDYSIMTKEQIDWLNKYNKRVLEEVGGLLKEQGDMEAYDWVKRRTEPVTMVSGAGQRMLNEKMIYVLLMLYLVFLF